MTSEPGSSVITEEIKKLIGTESAPTRFEVERGAIRKVLRALQDSNTMWDGLETEEIGTEIAVPPAYYMSIKPKDPGIKIEVPLPRNVAGGEEWQFFAPVRLKLGQTILARRRLSNILEKQGKSGPMVLIIYEDSYQSESGQMLALRRTTGIRM